MVESPKSETLGGAEEGLDGCSSVSLSVDCGHCSGHSVQVQWSYVVEVGRETRRVAEALFRRVEIVTERDWYRVGVVRESVGDDRERGRSQL